jgi:hypothetical protein
MTDTTNTTAQDAGQQLVADAKASIETLFGTVLKDELGVVKPEADTYLTGIVSNPDPMNLVGQSEAWFASSAGKLGQMADIVVGDTAASIKTLMDLEADKLLSLTAGTTASATAAPTASATSTAAPSAA